MNRDKVEAAQIVERLDRRACGYAHDVLAANWTLTRAGTAEPDNMCPAAADYWIRSVYNGCDYGVCAEHLAWVQRTHPEWIADVFYELPAVDAVTFAERYAARSGEVAFGTPGTLDDLLRRGRAVFPCSCGEPACEGWQMLGFAETDAEMGLPAWPTSLLVELEYVAGGRKRVDTVSAAVARRQDGAASPTAAGAWLVFSVTVPAGGEALRFRLPVCPPYALISFTDGAAIEASDG